MKKRTEPEISKSCAFCEHGRELCDDRFLLCDKYGVVKSDYVCKKFSYDPLRRKPSVAANSPEFVSLEDL
ncbi:MAG: hypothetical protein J5922_03950 [Clostridia bacterium]|nr:hypothetical protein [Clostridia bacterium]